MLFNSLINPPTFLLHQSTTQPDVTPDTAVEEPKETQTQAPREEEVAVAAAVVDDFVLPKKKKRVRPVSQSYWLLYIWILLSNNIVHLVISHMYDI